MSSFLNHAVTPPERGVIWHTLNRLLIVLILVTVATVAGYRFVPEMTRRRDQEIRVETLRAEIDRLKQLVAFRQREEALLKNDPEYIGLMARDRLDVMKEGETIYRMENIRPDQSKMRRRD